MSTYSPISLEYFLNMELQHGGGGKEIIHQNGKLKKVSDVVNYFKDKKNTADVEESLKAENWQYYNCMKAEFRHNVQEHHILGWENMTLEYYKNLDPMSDEEIEIFLKDNPVEFDNGFIRHNYHRACAMIGRLINGKPYIPFYMETSKIYYEPRKKDGIHRITPVTNRIKLLSQMDAMGINRDEYCICQSGILSIMGVRDNDDLDIIISSNLRNQNISYPLGVEVFDKDRKKFDYFGAEGDDDILENYCITIDGYKFLEPRFYFARKFINKSERDISDWQGIKEFFCKESHKGYPFNFEHYKWGLPETVERVDVSVLDLKSLELIKDKYNRVVDGVNHGRAVYKGDGYYIKIFHPEYCRLNNFRDALSSGFLNGLVPALTHLVMDGEDIIGYITLTGEMISNDESNFEAIPQWFIRTVLRNCKQRSKVFYDLVPINIIRDSFYGQVSLIDLESVYDLRRLHEMEKHSATLKPQPLLEWISQI
jgi:hypothetical protein